MQVKLRQVGNSIGLTIPASELKVLAARPGDTVELQIIRVIRHARAGWDDPQLWQGTHTEPLLLGNLPENDFDTEDWQW